MVEQGPVLTQAGEDVYGELFVASGSGCRGNVSEQGGVGVFVD